MCRGVSCWCLTMDLDGETRFSDVDDAADRGAAGSRQSLRRATSPGQMSSDAASDVERIEGTSAPTVIIIEDGVERRRTPVNVLTRRDTLLKSSTDAEIDFEKSAVYIAENSIEAARISNNYKVRCSSLVLSTGKNLVSIHWPPYKS